MDITEHIINDLVSVERDKEIIFSFVKDLLNTNTLEDIAWCICKNAIAKLGFVDCVVYFVDKKKGVLYQQAAHGPKNPVAKEIICKITIPFGKGIVGSVADSGEAVIINDTSDDERYILDDNYRLSEIAVPIYVGDEVIGVIDSEHPDKNFFTQYHLQMLKDIAQFSSGRIEHALALEKLNHYQNKLESLVQERTIELINRNDQLLNFNFVLSHDLKQSVRSISNFSELIQKEIKQKGTVNPGFLDIVISSSKELYGILNKLFEFQHAQDSPYENEKVNLFDLIKQVQNNIGNLLKERNAQINCKVNHSFWSSRIGIFIILKNLIENGIKYNESKNPIINVSWTENEDSIIIDVEDNGIGIPIEDQPKIFGLFNRLETNQSGSGIGLSIVKNVCEKLNAKISIKNSIPGEGTTFSVCLPKK